MKGLDYCVDIVFCLDCSGSMQVSLFKLKKLIPFIYKSVMKYDEYFRIKQVRCKVIGFRDYYYDGEQAMTESNFLILPYDDERLTKFVQELHPMGGGDEPESALEALALAMKSEWTMAGDKQRHIIVLLTDASAHPLEIMLNKKPAHYPKKLPTNLEQLTDLWELNIDNGGAMPYCFGRRIVICAPDTYPWTHIANNWENTIMYTSQAGQGLVKFDFDAILDALFLDI
jgi:hypothetical protein